MSIKYHTADFVSDASAGVAVFRRDPAFAVLPHYHSFDELVLVSRGTGIHVVDGRARAFQEGDVLVVRSGQCHHYREVHDLAIASVLIFSKRIHLIKEFEWFENLYIRCFDAPQSEPRQMRLHPSVRDHARRLVAELELCQNGSIDIAEQKHLLAELMLCVTNGVSAGPETSIQVYQENELMNLSIAFAHLESSFRDAEVLNPLSDLLHMSERTVLRKFHQVTGRSPIAYVGDLRMHHAMLALRKTSRLVTDIAYGSGFNDLSYFHRRFRQLTESSPHQWRKRPCHLW